MVKFPEELQGSDEDGNASSDEGSGADEAGNGSAGVEGNDSGMDAAVCVDAAGGSFEGSVGSDQGGKATSSIDSCACAARINEKKIVITSADVLPAIRRTISATVGTGERAEIGTQRWSYRA